MRKLKLEMQISLDGYAAAVDDNINWLVWNWSEDWNWDNALRQYHTDLATSSDCVLLSRKMAEEGFIDHWANVAANPDNPQSAFAKPVTDMHKVVFSRTLEQSRWENSELASGDLAAEIHRLKNQPGKDMIVYGGAGFVSNLIQAGLIDEFHLVINPIVLGKGAAIFRDRETPLNLKLATAQSFDDGIVVLKYLPNTN